jgi:preprotein translocase SecE subunit
MIGLFPNKGFFIKRMKLLNYIKDTKLEMSHVSWPTKRQAAVFTFLVILISILTAAFLGVFDMIFVFILEKIL